MRSTGFLIKGTLFLTAMAAACSPVEKRAAIQVNQPSDEELLQGRWHLARINADGKEERPRSDDGVIVFKNGICFKDQNGQQSELTTYILQPTNFPKQIQFIERDGPDVGETVKGIYLIDGDTVKLCMTETDELPKEFKTTTNCLLIILNRLK